MGTSTWGPGGQSLLNLLAAVRIFLQDLPDMLLFFTLQDTQEVLQLRHTKSIPLQKSEREKRNIRLERRIYALILLREARLGVHILKLHACISEDTQGLRS